jgi:hypothetical protein
MYEVLQATSAAETQKAAGIPKCYEYGSEGDFNFMAIELLGPTLETLMRGCGGKLSLRTVLLLATQLVSHNLKLDR